MDLAARKRTELNLEHPQHNKANCAMLHFVVQMELGVLDGPCASDRRTEEKVAL